MDIPFGWTEKNANTILSLIMIKNNGFFEQFWKFIREKQSYKNIRNIRFKKVA